MIITALLKIPKIRAKFIHSIKQNYFDELDISIPLQNNYWAKLFRNDSYDSFSEIFIQNEYEGFIPDIEINRIIDLGAHHGFFSIWIQCNRPGTKLKSLLVEPSARCFPVLRELTQRKEYLNNFHFLNKCIGNPQDEEILFFDRPHMAASKYKTENNEIPLKVSVLMSKDIFDWQQPPYDILKCDIEGAEWDLLRHYHEILENTKFLLIEWHNTHGKYEDFTRDCKKHNLELIKTTKSISEVLKNRSSHLLLLRNKSFKN